MNEMRSPLSKDEICQIVPERDRSSVVPCVMKIILGNYKKTVIGELNQIIKPILCVEYFEYRLETILHAFSLIGPDPVRGPFDASHGQRRREIWLIRKILKNPIKLTLL